VDPTELQPDDDGSAPDDRLLDGAAADEVVAADAAESGDAEAPVAEPRPDPVPCPYCAALIEPPPRTRRCPACRQQVIVRHVDRETRYLTASAAAVLEAERRRDTDVKFWTDARRHWLTLAMSVHAPADLCAKIAAMPISDRAVEAARAVYRTASDQAVRDARETGHWVRIARIRGIEADELYRDAGSPKPPPADILALYRESKIAVLHSMAVHGTVAELAASTCCATCRADEGVLVKIASELHKQRLPHEGCPRGLCGCDWFMAVPEAKPARRRKPRVAKPAADPVAPGVEPGLAAAEPAVAEGPDLEPVEPTDDAEPGAPAELEAAAEPEAAEPAAAQPKAPKVPARRARKPKTNADGIRDADGPSAGDPRG
jgi:hypothetical protein